MQNPVMFVDPEAIRFNAKIFRSLISPSVELCAVVKADAYGHGAEIVSGSLQRSVDRFAVSTIDEGCSLRVSGIQKDILVLTPPTSRWEAARAHAYDLALSVGDERSLSLCRKEHNRVHIVVNTGMNRYGWNPLAFQKQRLTAALSSLRAEGIYSHLYRPENKRIAEEQQKLFCAACDEIERAAERKFVKHLSATGGTTLGKEYHFDMVRIGLGLYGYLPFAVKGISLRRAMRVVAPVVSKSGGVLRGCGYGDGKGVCTVRFGYADGLQKACGLSRNGLCMDAFVSEKSMDGFVCVMSDAEKSAKRMGTIAYEVLCSFGERVERIYVGRKESVAGAHEADPLGSERNGF